jgi:hypothetical protein
MGFEHGLYFAPPLDSPTLERLLTCFKSPPTWPLVQAEQDGKTCVLHYAHAAEMLPVWEEDFLIDLSDQKLYLLLHTATSEQEKAVLEWIQHCLHASGLLKGALQEL